MQSNRRQFIATSLAAGLGAWLTSCITSHSQKPFEVTDADQDAQLGHRLRDKQFPTPSLFFEQDVVIIGAGVAGLSAARRLTQLGIKNACILELSKRVGGNAAAGLVNDMPCPLGAHYLPVANHEDIDLLDFLEEAKIIVSVSSAGIPTYKEEYLVHAPDERLFYRGQWVDGLIPTKFLTVDDKQAFETFFYLMEAFRLRKGEDQKWIFNIPLEQASVDTSLDYLDQISMQAWMRDQGLNNAILDWYVDYSCKDDFGTTSIQVSAWAGIHYFAARRGLAENADRSDVLTWPQGNAFLVERLLEATQIPILHEQLVYNVVRQQENWQVFVYDGLNDRSVVYNCKSVIGALPIYIAKRFEVYKEMPIAELSYAPWVVANVFIRDTEHDLFGRQNYWDNVIFESNTLGYIQSNHQLLSQQNEERVITFYWAMTDDDTKAARDRMRQTPTQAWGPVILGELKKAHPQIASFVEKIEIKLWGHAMLKPLVGTVKGANSQWRTQEMASGYFPAHTDYSGLSLFEEAFSQGVKAGNRCSKFLTTLS